MSSSWRDEILAVMAKEATTELRSRSGLMTSLLFSIVAVMAVSIATSAKGVSGTFGAGLLWVALLFAAAIALPRAFTIEEEQGTADFLFLTARAHSVFWGKALYNLVLMLLVATLLSLLFFVFVWVVPEKQPAPWLFVFCMFSSCGALAGAVTLCGALVAKAANRTALAAAVSLPLLLPLVFLGISGLRVALGDGVYEGGVKSGIGLLCYAIAALATGPYLFAAVWKS